MDDAKLLAPVPCPFSEMVMFTCTYESELVNINYNHEELTDKVGPVVARSSGPVKALNSNFGHYCQPGYESLLKLPVTKKPTNIQSKQRKPQGDGTGFNSAVGLSIIPTIDDATPRAIRDIFDRKPDKRYSVKTFPTTGKSQVPGVIGENCADGPYVMELLAEFLTEAGVAEDPEHPITVRGGRPIMLNHKFHLLKSSDRIIVNLGNIVEFLEDAKGTDGTFPYPIREIKGPQDSQNLSFKFVCPYAAGGGGDYHLRVNIFYGGKVNLLGGRDFESAKAVHRFLNDFFFEHWEDFIGLEPLPDEPPARRKVTAAKPVLQRLEIAPDYRITDVDVDEIIHPASMTKIDDGGFDIEAMLARAREFELMYSYEPPLNEMENDDVEDHEEDSLDDDAIRGRASALDSSSEVGNDIIGEDIADHQHEDEEH